MMPPIFHMPRGVCAVNEPSGAVFSPTAGYTVNVVVRQKWERVYHVACSVDQIEQLVAALVDVCLTEPFYAILSGHWFGERVDTYLSAFLPRARIDAPFRQHMWLLLQDGMVGHGFAWHDDFHHEELFVDDHKELTVWTSKPNAVEEILARQGLARIEGLEFLSEHGHAHLSLSGPDAAYCHQIIQLLEMEKVPITEDA
jgi:hypothetical protein